MIEVLCGPIASGKSTYSLKRAREGAVIVNDDALVLAIHGGDYSLYSPTLKPLYKTVQMTLIHSAVMMGADVVVDGVNHRRSSRQRLIQIAKSLDTPVSALIFRDFVFEGEEDGRRRFKADNRGLSRSAWAEVGAKHALQAEPIDVSEGFNSVVNIPWRAQPWR